MKKGNKVELCFYVKDNCLKQFMLKALKQKQCFVIEPVHSKPFSQTQTYDYSSEKISLRVLIQRCPFILCHRQR